jgi:hypothetical protein
MLELLGYSEPKPQENGLSLPTNGNHHSHVIVKDAELTEKIAMIDELN